MGKNSNLRPPSSEEARTRGKKGGLKSGEARRAKSLKTFKQTLQDSLTQEEVNKMIDALKRYAEDGSLSHLDYLLKMVGEAPEQTVADDKIEININGGANYAD